MQTNAPQPEHRGNGGWLWRRPQRWFLFGIPIGALIAVLVGIALAGAVVGGLKLSETQKFCTSCHEMNAPYPEYVDYTQSVHGSNEFGIRATCADCHIPPTFVAGLVRHIESGGQDVWGHLTGTLDTPEKFKARRLELAQQVWAELKANDSAECRRCHTPSAMALKQQPSMAADAHGSLATSGMTCIDCHKGVAHTPPPES